MHFFNWIMLFTIKWILQLETCKMQNAKCKIYKSQANCSEVYHVWLSRGVSSGVMYAKLDTWTVVCLVLIILRYHIIARGEFMFFWWIFIHEKWQIDYFTKKERKKAKTGRKKNKSTIYTRLTFCHLHFSFTLFHLPF